MIKMPPEGTQKLINHILIGILCLLIFDTCRATVSRAEIQQEAYVAVAYNMVFEGPMGERGVVDCSLVISSPDEGMMCSGVLVNKKGKFKNVLFGDNLPIAPELLEIFTPIIKGDRQHSKRTYFENSKKFVVYLQQLEVKIPRMTLKEKVVGSVICKNFKPTIPFPDKQEDFKPYIQKNLDLRAGSYEEGMSDKEYHKSYSDALIRNILSKTQ